MLFQVTLTVVVEADTEEYAQEMVTYPLAYACLHLDEQGWEALRTAASITNVRALMTLQKGQLGSIIK